MIGAVLVALITFEFSKLKFIGVIRASALVGILIYLVGQFFAIPESILYGASFVGMCAHFRFDRAEVLISGIIYYYLFNYISASAEDYGGLLGLCAFLAVLLVLLVNKLFNLLNARRSRF